MRDGSVWQGRPVRRQHRQTPMWSPSAWILLTVDSLSIGCSFSVISVNGWHELFEPHSYRSNND